MNSDTANTVQPKSNPPYLLGLLGFIPLVGAFVGLGLFLYGLIKYKDKWLMLIGIGGIVFSVVIYSSFFWGMKNASVFRQGFKELSQMQLNSLVRHIEFYNLQYGKYPDNLAALQAGDPMAPVSDPIQGSQLRKITDFEYQKIGDKYTVYSSGEDGKPGTADDLYPKIIITDSSRIGLIIKRQSE